MILFDNIIEILGLSQFDVGFIGAVVIFNRRRVGAALVDGDLVRQTRLINRFAKEA